MASERISGAFSTCRMVIGKSENFGRAVGSRSASNSSRRGCNATAIKMQTHASPRRAGLQPNEAAIGASTIPEMASPAGTPVCLIEKTSGAHLGGAYLASICELAGVATVEPALFKKIPNISGGSANHGCASKAAAASPIAIAKQPIWLVRSAPQRRKAPPHPAITRIATAA